MLAVYIRCTPTSKSAPSRHPNALNLHPTSVPPTVVVALATNMGIPEPGFFEVGYIGLPAGVIGIIYLIIFAPIILPKSGGMFKDMMKDRHNLITEARVTENFAMIGKPVSELLAKLGLPTETVIKIRRRNFDDSSTPAALNADPFLEIYPVLPTEPIMAGDIVFLSGEGKTPNPRFHRVTEMMTEQHITDDSPDIFLSFCLLACPSLSRGARNNGQITL